MANCGICQRPTAVSLYVRVKPMFFVGANKLKAGNKETHHFFGYWPPESYLANYFKLEAQRGDPILQPIYMKNCKGHSLEEITSVIEEKCPPLPEIPVRILWNPSPKVTPLLLADSQRDRWESNLDKNNDLRWVTIYEKEKILSSLKTLFNTATTEYVEHSVSYSNGSVIRH